MKTKQTILKAFASAALALGAFASADAQTNLGASCGCPAVGSRTTVNVSSLPGYTAIAGTFGGELTSGATFTCDKTYILDKKIYIPAGQTLTIAPGTLIKGASNPVANPEQATALIIERGGKIMALGTESCPIVFTAQADALDGTFGVSNITKWGGVVVLGKASNNLTLAANGPFVPGGAGKLAVADGLGTVEGFASTNPQDQYGVALSVPANYVTGTSPSSSTYTMDINLGTQGTGSGAIGNSKITLSSSSLAAYVFVGMPVSGTGIPAGTTVTAVSSATITLSAALTAAAAGSYTFTGTYPQAPSTTQLFYSVTNAPAFANNTYGPFATSGNNINYAAPFAGATAGTFDDNDNSGIMKYVSIRHSGAILAVGAEINGLTLASVGRGTTIEHIEIVSCGDDNIELFGGTVNLKYITSMFGNDDMIDWDLGWSGKAQFLFGMKSDLASAVAPDNDNGFEMDTDDGKSYATPYALPVIYNATLIGNAKATGTSDNSGLAGIQAKEFTGGEIYNSIIANFRSGFNLYSAVSANGTAGARTYALGGDTWHNWTTLGSSASLTTGNGSQRLKVKCNTFVGCTKALTVGASSSSAGTEITAANSSATGIAAGDEYTQFTVTDKNVVVTGNTLPGFDYSFAVNGSTNAITTKNDITPNPALDVTGCPVAPFDGFFEPANYRGAFSSVNGQNWLSNWTYSQVLNSTKGVRACATDLNLDGTTDVNDFLIFAPAFGTSCN